MKLLRIIPITVTAVLSLSVAYLGVNYVGNLLQQVVPKITYALESRETAVFNDVTFFKKAFLFTIPSTYKFLHFIFLPYVAYTRMISPLVSVFSDVARDFSPSTKKTQKYTETEGERLDRFRMEMEEKIQQVQSVEPSPVRPFELDLEREALREERLRMEREQQQFKEEQMKLEREREQAALEDLRKQMQEMEKKVEQASTQPTQPQIQVVPIPVPTDYTQKGAMPFGEHSIEDIKLQPPTTSSDTPFAADKPTEVVKEVKDSTKNAQNGSETILGAEGINTSEKEVSNPSESVQPKKEVKKVLVPATSINQSKKPAKPKAFKRNKGLQMSEEEMEEIAFPTPVAPRNVPKNN